MVVVWAEWSRKTRKFGQQAEGGEQLETSGWVHSSVKWPDVGPQEEILKASGHENKCDYVKIVIYHM